MCRVPDKIDLSAYSILNNLMSVYKMLLNRVKLSTISILIRVNLSASSILNGGKVLNKVKLSA